MFTTTWTVAFFVSVVQSTPLSKVSLLDNADGEADHGKHFEETVGAAADVASIEGAAGGVAAAADTTTMGLSDRVEQLEGLFNSETNAAEDAALPDDVKAALAAKMEVFPGMKSIQALLDWTPETAGPYMGPSAEKLVLPNRARVMSIHDMAGGYKQIADNDYLATFTNWELVDIFVYFSHIRVAVPPLQWTGVAHSHGKFSMGTIMFEGGDGSNDAQVLTDNEDEAVKKFAAVTKHYGFDGWLVNLESGWGGGKDPLDFCSKLRSALKKEVGDYAQVVAYPREPSAEIMGKVDGVYVNYNWNPSASNLKRFSEDAAGRPFDVYLGFDAWGQMRGNTFTHDVDQETKKNLVTKAEEFGLSVAVFAPGFVLEHQYKGHHSNESRAANDTFWKTMGIVTTTADGGVKDDIVSPQSQPVAPLLAKDTKEVKQAAAAQAKAEAAAAGAEAEAAAAGAEAEAAAAGAEARPEFANAQSAESEVLKSRGDIVRYRKREQDLLLVQDDLKATIDELSKDAKMKDDLLAAAKKQGGSGPTPVFAMISAVILIAGALCSYSYFGKKKEASLA